MGKSIFNVYNAIISAIFHQNYKNWAYLESADSTLLESGLKNGGHRECILPNAQALMGKSIFHTLNVNIFAAIHRRAKRTSNLESATSILPKSIIKIGPYRESTLGVYGFTQFRVIKMRLGYGLWLRVLRGTTGGNYSKLINLGTNRFVSTSSIQIMHYKSSQINRGLSSLPFI